MQIIPAIDIRKGNVVRLFKGLYHKETVYSNDPLEIAKKWKNQGAEILHIVDLEGAFWGSPKNLDQIQKIIEQTNLKVHLGGGIRSLEDIETALKIGVHRVIMSTKVFEDKKFLPCLPPDILKKIIVSFDCKDGIVQTKGWTRKTTLTISDAVKQMELAGIEIVVVTDIDCDGTLEGPNTEFLAKILKSTKMKLIASGGISRLEDVKKILQLKTENLFGIIIGKALYENRISLKEVIEYAKQEA